MGATARMLARVAPEQCDVCRCPPSLDCVGVGTPKRTVRVAERNETLREADLYMAERRTAITAK